MPAPDRLCVLTVDTTGPVSKLPERFLPITNYVASCKTCSGIEEAISTPSFDSSLGLPL